MGGPCSTYGGEERYITGLWWENVMEKDHLGDPGIDGRIILKWIFRMWDGGIDLIYLAQNRARC